jgi:hypothetical protein
MDKKFYEAPEMEMLKMHLGCEMLQTSQDVVPDDPGQGGEGDDEIIF